MNYYTIPETAKILKLRKAFVYRAVNTGLLPATRLSERRIRVSEEDIRGFMQEMKARTEK